MHPDLESLLREDLIEVPDGFAQRIMAHVAVGAPLPARSSAPRPAGSRWIALLQFLALAAGFSAGALQLAGFMFGLWTAASAG
jgi:hypothetical protein